MPPKFSLQPVLNYHHNRVEYLEIELGNLLSNRQREAERLIDLQSFRHHLFRELADQQDGELDLGMIGRLRSNLKTTENNIIRQRQELSSLDQQIISKQSEIVNARQDEETLETLKDKAVDRYRKEEIQKENRLQDDIYIAQAFNRMTSAPKL